jgi:hypothetical protein
MRIRAPLLATAALTLAITLMPTTPASAEQVTFDDAVGDTNSRSDVRWVEVMHSNKRDRFQVRVRLDQVRYGVELVVYVDRRRGNPGPELRMVALADSEWALYRVVRWGQRGTRIDTCGRVSYSPAAGDVARWRSSRTCLDLGPQVRVAVKVRDDGYGVDWAPQKYRFFPAVSAS